MELDPIYYNATRKLALINAGIFNEPIFDAEIHLFKKERNLKKKELKSKTKRVSEKPKVNLLEQPLPITINNFFIRTKGDFKEIQKIPDNYSLFFKSKGSEYYTNKQKTRVIRISDHWGKGIKNCAWYLEGYDRINCGIWKKAIENPVKIGIINIENLEINGSKKARKITNRQLLN
jgi:hypothetical protein